MTASRVALALLIAVAAAPLFADEDALDQAATALEEGDDSAIELAAAALKQEPLGAAENRQAALTWFWAGHFEDAARYLRRALAADPNALMDRPLPSEVMPARDVTRRLNELAGQIDDDPDLCFLTGAVLLLNNDRPRALAFLVRAAELAGTDGQADALIRDNDESDRNELRALAALKTGDYADAERSFTFAALDAPTVAEYYAGLAIALSAAGQDDMARRIAGNAYARYHHERMFAWLAELDVVEADVLAAARRLDVDGAPSGDCRLAMILYMTVEHWRSARQAGVKGLMENKLDAFIQDARIWMDDSDLHGDPDNAPESPQPEDPEPPADAPDDEASLSAARAHVRAGEFVRARNILDEHTGENVTPEVCHLLFVALAGCREFEEAAVALQAWYQMVDDEDRMSLNSLRELFGKQETFDAWRGQISAQRDERPNAFAPRLLSCYVEITRGRYSSARADLAVARIDSPRNATALGLHGLLQKEEYARDVTADGIPDDLSAKALYGEGDSHFRNGRYEDARSAYLKAQERDRELPHVSAALFRCHFALGDYDGAYTQFQRMIEEQDTAETGAGAFQLLLKNSYGDNVAYESHLEALKNECARRELSWKPWLLYGVILVQDGNFEAALEALQTWRDNFKDEHDPVHMDFYELAKERAS